MGGWRCPQGGLQDEGVTGDEFGVGLVGFGPTQFALGKGVNFCRINSADRITLSD
jgi:hypothetical protein